jgi:hypothetical protein
LLNTLALQVALWADVRDPTVLKHVFLRWEYALPALLYAGVFVFLWRTKKIVWGIFPLIGWAILSPSVDWNPINSTRWAMPLLWMHFFFVLFVPQKQGRYSMTGVAMLGLAMLGGLYESVVLYAVLVGLLGLGLWWREKNRVPFYYALAALPGALRSVWSMWSTSDLAPNSFHGIILPYVLAQPYFLFILLTLIVVIGLMFLPRRLLPTVALFSGVGLLTYAAIVLSSLLPMPWAETEMKYDYAILTLVLMVLCAAMRLTGRSPETFVMSVTPIVLLAGAVLWMVQIQQTYEWQDCRDAYGKERQGAARWLDAPLAGLIRNNPAIGKFNKDRYYRCLWGQYTPWTDLLLAQDGQVRSWSMTVFWQDFSFVQKSGGIYLHTNGLSLVSPAFQSGDADLPLKTLLWDLTPLYKRVGLGDLFPRVRCLPVAESDPYWTHHLEQLNDEQRQRMFVCPGG